jgi:fermentation-respiration switch protein FrsA (DUF1100 family)
VSFLPKLLLALACIAAAGLFGGGLALGLLLSSPAQTTVGAPPADLKAEPVTFPSGSGATIRGWFIAGRPGGGAVVLMHGVRGNRAPMLPRARMLRDAGYSVLLFDFQAHGESTGSRITFGYREGRDTVAAAGFVRQRVPGEKIGAIGVSLGGAAALLAPGTLAVDALVLEGVYPDIDAATENRVNDTLGPWLGPVLSKPLAWVLALVTAPLLGVAPADLRPIDHMANVRAPLLMLIGAVDTYTTVAETNAMFTRAPEPKSLWIVDGAGHVDLRDHAPEAYRARVFDFLSRHLRRPP